MTTIENLFEAACWLHREAQFEGLRPDRPDDDPKYLPDTWEVYQARLSRDDSI